MMLLGIGLMEIIGISLISYMMIKMVKIEATRIQEQQSNKKRLK